MSAFIILFRNLTVVLGTNDLSRVNAGMRYNVRKCKHGDYKEVTFGNDIMMLKVRTYTLPFLLLVTCNICLRVDRIDQIFVFVRVPSPPHFEVNHFNACFFLAVKTIKD